MLGVLILAMVSCALSSSPKIIKTDRTKKFTLHVDSSFQGTERAIILNSFDEWQRDTHGIVRFVISPNEWNSKIHSMNFNEDTDNGCTDDVYVVNIRSDDKIIRSIEKDKPANDGNTLGYTMRTCESKVVAFVMDRIRVIGGNTLRFVGVHEVGHLIGLAHIPVPKESIMFPSMDRAAKCITRLDMAQFCMLYGCNFHDMKYCSS